MLADVVLDTEAIASALKNPLTIGGLSLGALWAFFGPLIKKWFDSLPKTKAEAEALKDADPKAPGKEVKVNPVVGVNTDKAPPAGFVEHVNTILSACNYADPMVQLRYLVMGLTEAEVLKREVARMGGKKIELPPEIVVTATKEVLT